MGGRERILLIDDETSIVEMYREMLESLGYVVTIDDNPLGGLESFRSNPEGFDMVNTDQTMPEMTGTQLAVKTLDIRPVIPIILYSGYSSLVDQQKAEEIGISAFAMKSIDRTRIGALIRSTFKKKNDRSLSRGA